MAWLFLFIASLFEICWLYTLKYMEWGKIYQVLFKFDGSAVGSLVPLAGYVGFGICNVICYSTAMKSIPASTAFAVWTGTAIVGSKLIDVFFFKENYSIGQFIFLGIIIIGIVGVKFSSAE